MRWSSIEVTRLSQKAGRHDAKAVAPSLNITLVPLPGYSPDLMPVGRCGAGCARMSPTITAMPRPRT
jgi:hypothetical protein